MTDDNQQQLASPADQSPNLPQLEQAWVLLQELVRIRKIHKQKFIPYDQQRSIKREERIAWQSAEELVEPKPKAIDPVDRAIAHKHQQRKALQRK